MADDISRIETRLDSFGSKMDEVLRLLGKVEPLLEDVPKLRDKLQALEVANAGLTADVASVKQELKEARLKGIIATLVTSGAVAGGAALVEQLAK